MGLYFTFMLAGLVLFVFICFYSVRTQRENKTKLEKHFNEIVNDEALKPSVTMLEKNHSVDSVDSTTTTVLTSETDKTIANKKNKEEPVLRPNDQVNSLLSETEHELSADSTMKPRTKTIKEKFTPRSKKLTGKEASDFKQVDSETDATSTTTLNSEDAQGQTSMFDKLIQRGGNNKSLGADSTVNAQAAKSTSVSPRSVSKKVSWDERECELVAKILGKNAISRDEILTIFRKYDFLLARKLHVYGFNTLTQVWSDVEREDVSAVFTDLGVSVQLADKSGALTRKELNTVSQLVLQYAESFNRQFSFSMDLDEAIEIGRELDELGRRHSAMVVLNIIPKRKDGFRSSDIDSCTRDLNMSQSDTGVFTRYRRNNNRSNLLYHVAVADESGQFRSVKKQSPFRVHDIVVYLNVPTVEDPTVAFLSMAEEAKKLATWLDGKLVDKHRRNMTTKGVKLLKEQVDEIEQNMRNDGISPGGLLSRKLF